MEQNEQKAPDKDDGRDQRLQRGGEAALANEAAISRLALQQRLLSQANVEAFRELQEHQRQQIVAQHQQLSLQQRLAHHQHQQLVMQQHLQQQAASSLTNRLPGVLPSSVGLSLPANQLGLSGLNPFGPHSLAEARLLAASLDISNSAAGLPATIGGISALRQNALFRSGALAESSLNNPPSGIPPSLLSSQSEPTGRARPMSLVNVLEQYAAKGAKEPPFPLKLHQILSNPDYQDCICWLPHGKAWRILKPSAFEQVVIPHFFRHAKYASFMRQVNGWGFKRMVQGVEHNSYFHELFVRDHPELCLKMKRAGHASKLSESKVSSEKSESSKIETKDIT